MACQKVGNAYICGLPDYQTYICFEHTTYLFEFSRQFGPFFFRIECGREIDVDIGFNDNDEPTSNKFLWNFFEEWHHPETIKDSEI